jgi:TfoX/Sxy family transcriptional regulator of competence genes
MPYSESLADRIREALVDIPKVEEKKMFGGLTFMVDDKMCICISGDGLLWRTDPALRKTLLSKDHVREMIHGKRVMKGFIYVEEDAIKTQKQLDYWITLCLHFNKDAKASKKPKKK